MLPLDGRSVADAGGLSKQDDLSRLDVEEFPDEALSKQVDIREIACFSLH
jgi:hypothetical protein